MSAQTTINDLSAKLLELVYLSSNPHQTLEQYLTTYGIAVSDAIVDELQTGFGNPLLLTVPAINTMLQPQLITGPYQHSNKVIDEYLQNKATIAEMAKNPAGMGVDNQLVTLPRTITGPTTAKLKNLPLKNAYLNLLNSRNQTQYAKNLRWALEAKTKYLALRIADTEEAKAFTYNRTKKYLEQGIEYVRWKVSSRHVDGCLCDYYRDQDIGFGPGVYELKSAPMPVFSTHPHCRCSLVPFRKTPTTSPSTSNPRPPGFPEVTVPDMFPV